jgi:hypothetical protein
MEGNLSIEINECPPNDIHLQSTNRNHNQFDLTNGRRRETTNISTVFPTGENNVLNKNGIGGFENHNSGDENDH